MASGVVHLDEQAAVFAAMLSGWERQQRSRLLAEATIEPRVALLRRFTEFAGSFPWQWNAGDVEDFTLSLMSGGARLAPSTIRGYHLTLRMFCAYLLDGRYGWVSECEQRFGAIPSQVCHDFNTVAHLNDYEGRRAGARSPTTSCSTYSTSSTPASSGCNALAARVHGLRYATLRWSRPATPTGCADESCACSILRTCARTRICANGEPTERVHVRYGKAVRGSTPRRRTVLTVPEFDWVVDGLRQWVEQARPLLDPDDRDALWLTERRQRVSVKSMDNRFAWLREQADLDTDLTLHCLRHSYVTHLIEFGYPERFVTEQVGHSYASTTAIYTNVSNDFKTKTLKAALARVYDTQEER